MQHPTHIQTRPEQLKALYIGLIDRHLADLVNGRADNMLDIEDFAALLFIHPTHLSNSIKETTGISACENRDAGKSIQASEKQPPAKY